ncbi:MAG: leucine-rich repeat protein [Clostridia bacterium]|nr:leucine-rich repeat protein [Clostridia bacterium]
MDALSLQISDYAQMLAQASSENETLRRQLEEAQKALEEEKARADAEKAEFQAQVDAQKKQQQPSPSLESDFNYEIRNGKATITKYTGKGGDVVIPDTLGGYPVSIVGDKAFYKCDSLTNVTIPDSVKSIGVNAFYGCGSLTSVTIPSSVTSIGGSAFYGCSSLKSITIPSSVTSIGSYTFYECLGLTSVTIPDSVTSIGVNAFSSCNKSLIIYISKGSYAESYCKRWKLNYKLQ